VRLRLPGTLYFRDGGWSCRAALMRRRNRPCPHLLRSAGMALSAGVAHFTAARRRRSGWGRRRS
jgi:hypothetical protein